MKINKIGSKISGDYPCELVVNETVEGGTKFTKQSFPAIVQSRYQTLCGFFSKLVKCEVYENATIECNGFNKKSKKDAFTYTFSTYANGFYFEMKFKKIEMSKHDNDAFQAILESNRTAKEISEITGRWDLENAILDGVKMLEDAIVESWEELSRLDEPIPSNQPELPFDDFKFRKDGEYVDKKTRELVFIVSDNTTSQE